MADPTSPYDPDLDNALDEEWGPPDLAPHVTDPQPLTDDELTMTTRMVKAGGTPTTRQVRRLVATVEQARKERDALRLRFANLVEGVLSFAEAETNAIIAAGLRAMVEDDDDIRDYLSLAEVDAVRRAQATTEETSHE